MILFQTEKHEIDFSNLPVTFNEKSNYFSDSISKSYSYPFNVKLNEDIIEKLQMVIVNNIVKYETKIFGNLIIDRVFYSNAYISINDVQGENAELTLFYGSETLKVFDKNLVQLPFPVVFAQNGLQAFASSQITKQWPEATHNFPKVFRPKIKDEPNYENFNLFLNNYQTNGQTFSFLENSIEVIDNEEVLFNRNVMCPFPYLLEVLKTIFATEGLSISGDFVNDDFNKKILLVPKQYMEQYAQTDFLNYSFANFNTQETIDGKTVNVYTQIHTPTSEGSYSLDMRLNLSNTMAQYFSLTVTQGGVELYAATSQNKEVNIEHTLDINIVDTQVFEDITVQLKINYQEVSIAAFNSFTYQFQEGQVNVFPVIYNLANFMPDLKVREFINRIKSTFNLKFDYTNTTVAINYLDNELERLIFEDHSHLQQVDPKRITNENNLFKLSYPDKEEILIDKNGQTYTDTDFTDGETEPIKIRVLPLKVKEKYGHVTAIYPEDEEDIMLCLYDGLTAGYNHAVDNINNQTLSLQDVYNSKWKQWLKFRANSETVKDSFYMPISETINIQKGSFKYNKNHLIKTIQRKRVNNQWWKVEVESETL